MGGRGGGTIWINAVDTVTIDGTITANGGTRVALNAGSGSGGGIYIVCDTVAGSGLVRADGGAQTGGEGGAGAGGTSGATRTSAP